MTRLCSSTSEHQRVPTLSVLTAREGIVSIQTRNIVVAVSRVLHDGHRRELFQTTKEDGLTGWMIREGEKVCLAVRRSGSEGLVAVFLGREGSMCK